MIQQFITKNDDDKQRFESNLKHFYLLRLNYMMVRDELTTREQVIHQTT